jgi:predicted dehydrogenase
MTGQVPRMQLTAVADIDPIRRKRFTTLPTHATLEDMIAEAEIDAVLLALPTYQRMPLTRTALEAGLHVMVERPLAVHKGEVERLLQTRLKPGQVAGAMFNQRADPCFLKVKELLDSGEVGHVQRVCWTVTDSFRNDCYYTISSWRATWAGEGGGALLNPAIGYLDLMHWLFGPVRSVRTFCGFGRYHPIEVEDDATAFLEFETGATGVFITSTGEAPGTNRLEIAAQRGRIVVESGHVTFIQNTVNVTDFSRTCSEPATMPPKEEARVMVPSEGGSEASVLTNFADAVFDGETLIAPLAEGIHSLELANAMLLSSWTGDTIDLPLDSERYLKWLDRKIAEADSR